MHAAPTDAVDVRQHAMRLVQRVVHEAACVLLELLPRRLQAARKHTHEMSNGRLPCCLAEQHKCHQLPGLPRMFNRYVDDVSDAKGFGRSALTGTL